MSLLPPMPVQNHHRTLLNCND